MDIQDREKAFEKKFEHDEALKFRIGARRAKLFGLWVAGQLGLTGDEALAYARSIVEVDLEEQGVEDILRKVRADLAAHAVTVSEHMLERHLGEALDEATRQIMTDAK